MPKLEELLQRLPYIGEARMVTSGFGVWVVWKTDVSAGVTQTLSDYGGLLVSQGRHQALWFFFSSDVALALARLEVWARLNPVPVFSQLMPLRLLLGMKLERSVSVEGGLANQEAVPPDEFQVLVHPKLHENIKAIPGLSLIPAPKLTGLASLPWKMLQADPRLPYQSSMGWYQVLKPLGNPLDKAFQAGWREFFSPLEELVKRLKLPFLLQDSYVLFPLENLRQLRMWCKEYLLLVQRLKEEQPGAYWPCVMAIVDKKGLNFNVELPRRLSLDWDQLMPDFPHMFYRTALLLAEGFRINDVRFSVDQSKVEDWCNVSLSGELEVAEGSLQIELPKRLVTGKETFCFYCGLRNHPLTSCPSRAMAELRPEIWDKVALLGLSQMRAGLVAVDAAMAGTPLEGVESLLLGGAPENLLIQAMFEINSPSQHRMARVIWRSTGKDYPRGLTQLGAEEKGAVIEALQSIQAGELIQAERLLSQAALRSPRGIPPRTLQGFTALERGDALKAQGLWKECESLSTSPLQQAYFMFLQARCLEIQGKLQLASSLYKQVLVITPRWLDAQYRQGVCLVKMGFAEQAMGFFGDIIVRDHHMFNRVLIDPELERGHIHLLSSMFEAWNASAAKALEERRALDRSKEEVGKWFTEDHPFKEEATAHLDALIRLGEIENYVAYNRLIQGRVNFTRDLQLKIEEEVGKLRDRFGSFRDRLKVIHGEAAWFPFPRLLVEFNKDFNHCVRVLNWSFSQHFQVADNFRKAQEHVNSVEEKLGGLEKQLKTLKVVRDSTLFVLILGKTFFWLELSGLVLSLLGVPLLVYLSQKMGYSWATAMNEQQKYELRTGLVLVLSIAALAVSSLRTALIFEGRKEKLFRKAQSG